MLRILPSFILIAFLLSQPGMAFPQSITLKKGGLGGWRYSTDSKHFRNVGITGNRLRAALGDCDLCHSELDAYKFKRGWAVWLSLGAGGLLGWGVATGYNKQKHTLDSRATIFGGLTLIVAAVVFSSSATNNLKEAVRLYNEEYDPAGLGFPHDDALLPASPRVGFAVTLRFPW